MTGDEIAFSSIEETAARLRDGSLRSEELTRLLLDRIEATQATLNAFITITSKEAMAMARRADEELAGGHDRGLLHGIPVALKDVFDQAGVATSAGTEHSRNPLAAADATVVAKLKSAGAVLLGKTNMDELAWGSTSSNPVFGAVANPWKLDHHPGGSSGGSAAAVAAGLAFAALGTDTGCSVRQPAQCCGVVGYKPSSGWISKHGVVPLVWTLDCVGVLARSVADCAILTAAIADYDPLDPDSTGSGAAVLSSGLAEGLEGLTIGIPRPYFFEGGDAEVIALVDDAIAALASQGATLKEVEIPNANAALDIATACFAEVVAAHGDAWRSDPTGFSPALQGSFESFAKHLASDYASAQHERIDFKRAMDALMKDCDLLAVPTSTITATPIGDPSSQHGRERWKNCAPFNLLGWPAISVPCGVTGDLLPAGLMIVGARNQDALVLQAASAYQRATTWHQQHPPE